MNEAIKTVVGRDEANQPTGRPAVLKVGIAGYGVVGKRRRHFLDLDPRFKVIAVCDRTIENGSQTDRGVVAYNNHRQLLAEDLDALFVCLPNDVAADMTIAGLERGLHVFCEKPPGRDLADIARVIACERRHPNLKLKYGFNHRYHESVVDALQIVKSGELGEIINIRGVYGKSRFISFGEHSDWRVNARLPAAVSCLTKAFTWSISFVCSPARSPKCTAS